MYSGFGFGSSLDCCCFMNNLSFEQQQLMQRLPPLMLRCSNMEDQAFSQTVSAHTDEIDRFLHSQNEGLRTAVQEQMRRQISVLTKRCESKIHLLINQRDEEIDRAAKRTAELQDYLKRMEIEREKWQGAARDNEATAALLSSAIERMKEGVGGGGDAAGDAESCCSVGEEEKKTRGITVCTICHVRRSCVVMLPCRHLCSCMDCDVSLDSCPVCKMVKRSSIQALL